jgi:hypothetical protein
MDYYKAKWFTEKMYDLNLLFVLQVSENLGKWSYQELILSQLCEIPLISYVGNVKTSRLVYIQCETWDKRP